MSDTPAPRKPSVLDLPLPARWVLLGVCLAATVAVWAAAHSHLSPVPHGWGELTLFLFLDAFASRKKIRFLPEKAGHGSATISVGVVVTFAALFRLGIGAAVLVGCMEVLSAALFPRRHAWYQFLFNSAQQVLQIVAAGLVFLHLNQGWEITYGSALPVLAAAVVCYVINTGLLATIIGVSMGQSPLKLWRAQFLWLAPSYGAAACAGAIGVYLCAHKVGGFVLLALPLLYPLYKNHSLEVGQAVEKQKHSDHLAELYLSTIKSLALAVDAKDQYTHQHILRVQRYAVAIAKRMGLADDELEGVNTGALLHDIGKIGVPDAVLLKPGRLTDEEFDLIKQHPSMGAQILGPVEFPWPVLPVVKYHHEKWDGTGYPEGLKGEAIPLTARILAVADVYDALTSNRSYRSAWSHEKARAEIERCAGSHFDPQVVDAFLQIIDTVQAEMAAENTADVPEADQDLPLAA
jgi:putative nucleotidyltransferase with HDIG domain